MSRPTGTRAALRRAFESIPPLWRDVVVAFLVIGVLMSGLWIYTGQPFNQAPLVVVESGSMMHPDSPYGRVGTIDPGDLILVKDVRNGDPDAVTTLYGSAAPANLDFPGVGGRDGYGLGGDVVIYRQDQCPGGRATPIIHRAITWVEVRQTAAGATFTYIDAAGNLQRDRPTVHLPDLGLSEESFPRSGWITQGDNPDTNRQADQVGICNGRLIEPDWLVGKARGEIPWIGLLKFIVQGNNVNRVENGWCTVINAHAPCDTFVMLWITLGVVVAVPLVWDLTGRLRRRRQDEPPQPPGPPPPPTLQPAHVRPPPRTPERPKPRWAPNDDELRRGPGPG